MPEPHELSDPRRPSPEGREGGWEGGTRPAVAGNVWRTRAGGARFSLRTFRHGRAAPSARTPESAVAAGAGVGGRDGRREQATWASEEGGGDLGTGPSARRADAIHKTQTVEWR